MTTDERKILDFLLSADFDVKKGYSYTELIKFLKAYKQFFIECYNAKENFRKELIQKDKTNGFYDNRIKELLEQIERYKSENEILTRMISRKLTFKERLLGKFKWLDKN